MADFRRTDSPARRFRTRRHEFFCSLIGPLPRPIRLLDVGGTEDYWRTLGIPDGVEVTALNLDAEPSNTSGLTTVRGDARDLSRFRDSAFDVAFSNSVIEHIPRDDQSRVAREIRRVGRTYFVQTPNRYFPIEPHVMFPCWQFLPSNVRIFLLMHLKLGWCGKVESRELARRYAAEIELLGRPRLRELFPEARIWDERAFGLVKSFVAYGGFPVARGADDTRLETPLRLLPVVTLPERHRNRVARRSGG